MVCFGDEDWAAAPHLGDARSSFVGIIPQLLRFRGAHADQVPVAPIMEVVKGATAEWVSQRVEEVARAEAGGGPAGSLSDDTLRLKGIGDVKIIVFAFGSGDVRLQTPVDSFAASARAACLSAAAVAGDTPCRLIVTSVPDESAAPPALGESSEAAWREQATTLVDAYNAALRGIVERNGGVFVDVTRVTRMVGDHPELVRDSCCFRCARDVRLLHPGTTAVRRWKWGFAIGESSSSLGGVVPPGMCPRLGFAYSCKVAAPGHVQACTTASSCRWRWRNRR